MMVCNIKALVILAGKGVKPSYGLYLKLKKHTKTKSDNFNDEKYSLNFLMTTKK